jgi:CheY-like chemotaxis protein
MEDVMAGTILVVDDDAVNPDLLQEKFRALSPIWFCQT